MGSHVISQRIGILLERGLFENEESLMLSAYRSLLTLQPELKTELALSLYEREEISLGRAAEIAGVSREQREHLLLRQDLYAHYLPISPECQGQNPQKFSKVTNG
jgi:predicted HTH domain antitoxin